MVGNKKLMYFVSLNQENVNIFTAACFKHISNYHIQIIGFFVKKDLVF